ncbi:hypothetical protein [Yinghuangia soli]|uniref:Uncharacterized protein n=1 Tax=Yinghuangia soli TaxID=2908204 RepID=A0AA41Q9L6_9ACTN|nr:hypothetical protein [Yinghuangia soli]MCF2532737.1 hypothetical protein [Yinghuangia soli]
MSDTEADAIAGLAGAGSVAADYRHQSKLTTAAADLAVRGAYLKWYDLRVPDREVTDEVRDEARALVVAQAASGGLDLHDELGFAILHLCGDAVRLLLVCTWRNENELWETVYAKQGDGPYELVAPTSHKGTYCVWELGAVWHEQQAWTRYLYSARDDKARQAYVAEDRMEGLVG